MDKRAILEEASGREQIKIVIAGDVDHGKSTFVGRLFHDTGSLPEGKLEELKQIAQRRRMPFEWANLMDALQSERDQNVTIDTAQTWLRIRKREYVLIDVPGHKEFLKNMVTGASHADAALMLLDAHQGVQEQSRRHAYLLKLLGVCQIGVLANKMDLEGYSQERFHQIEQEYCGFLQELGLFPKFFVPVCAKHGDNITTVSGNMRWWNGPTVVEVLDDFKGGKSPTEQPLRFPIQDVYRFDERRILAGRVESGSITVGDRLIFSPTNNAGTVKTIERWNALPRNCAAAGESIGITLTEQVFVERGAVAGHENAPPYELTRFKGSVFWLGRDPFRKGRCYTLKLATQEVECEIENIDQVIDASTLEAIPGTEGERSVGRDEVADLSLRTQRPMAFDAYSEIMATGRFVILDGDEIAGGGIIAAHNYPRRTAACLHKSDNIYWSEGKVSTNQRARRNTHPGCVIWLTGLSGAGKTTIATELERELFSLGKHAYVLDGDNMRHGLCSDLGFSREDRKENIRRVGEVANLFADSGMICITAFISPYRSDRALVREIGKHCQFLEVYVNAPLAVCEQRDPKGLYAKARTGAVKEFTGVSAPYEPPSNPEIELRTDQLTVAESVAKILNYLHLDEHDTLASI
jgi:bifunctional enzyme CysN/CysC